MTNDQADIHYLFANSAPPLDEQAHAALCQLLHAARLLNNLAREEPHIAASVIVDDGQRAFTTSGVLTEVLLELKHAQFRINRLPGFNIAMLTA